MRNRGLVDSEKTGLRGQRICVTPEGNSPRAERSAREVKPRRAL